MSRDLISRSALIERLKENLDDCDIQESLEFFGVYDIINSQPTAYNVDKVVEKLHEYQSAFPVDSQNDYFRGVGIGAKSCIEIVKAGGVE